MIEEEEVAAFVAAKTAWNKQYNSSVRLVNATKEHQSQTFATPLQDSRNLEDVFGVSPLMFMTRIEEIIEESSGDESRMMYEVLDLVCIASIMGRDALRKELRGESATD